MRGSRAGRSRDQPVEQQAEPLGAPGLPHPGRGGRACLRPLPAHLHLAVVEVGGTRLVLDVLAAFAKGSVDRRDLLRRERSTVSPSTCTPASYQPRGRRWPCAIGAPRRASGGESSARAAGATASPRVRRRRSRAQASSDPVRAHRQSGRPAGPRPTARDRRPWLRAARSARAEVRCRRARERLLPTPVGGRLLPAEQRPATVFERRSERRQQ